MKKISLLFSLFLLNITLYSQDNPFFTKSANSLETDKVLILINELLIIFINLEVVVYDNQ